jgi:putative endonuclease
MYYVYFLYLSNRNIYTGFTSDLKKRFEDHQKGKVQSTRSFLPIKLIGYEAYIKSSDALRREKYLKTTEGKRLFRQQYRDIILELR